MKTAELEFTLDKSKVLNANNKLHFIVHGKIVSYLRQISAERGLELHPEEERSNVDKRISAINSEQNWILMKKRERTKLKKKGLPEKEIEEIIEKDFEQYKPDKFKDEIPVNFLFDKFKVRVTVSPPTKRRMDVPNLYPTVKAVIDGLTDAALWEDDDFSHMKEMSFRYGTPTKKSGEFLFHILIQEIDENDDIL